MCKALMPGFKATGRMEIEDWVPVFEKCTVQWARAVGKAQKENKVFHPGNANISLDFFFVCLFRFVVGRVLYIVLAVLRSGG